MLPLRRQVPLSAGPWALGPGLDWLDLGLYVDWGQNWPALHDYLAKNAAAGGAKKVRVDLWGVPMHLRWDGLAATSNSSCTG